MQIGQLLENARALSTKDAFSETDVQLVDALLALMYQGAAGRMEEVNGVLEALKTNNSSMDLVPLVMENAATAQAKFFALQILDDQVKTRWKIISPEAQKQIQEFVVQMTIKLAQQNEEGNINHLIQKANAVLVSIVKQTWTSTWSTFVNDILSAAHTQSQVCTNVFNILEILSQEIFDYSKQTMPTEQVMKLKTRMNASFKNIFDLCLSKMEAHTQLDEPPSESITMMRSCLRCIKAFMSWIPLGYIFETPLLPGLLQYYLVSNNFRQLSLEVLLEVVSLDLGQTGTDQYLKETIGTFVNSLYLIHNTVLSDNELSSVYSKLESDVRDGRLPPNVLQQFSAFCQSLALYISGFFKRHLTHCEQMLKQTKDEMLMEAVKHGFQTLIMIAGLPEEGHFKVCMDYFNSMVSRIYQANLHQIQTPFGDAQIYDMSSRPIQSPLFEPVYRPVLQELRILVLRRMAKPPEVLVRINEEGEPEKEQFQNSEELALYQTLHEILVYLTNLSPEQMSSFMEQSLTSIIMTDPIDYDAMARLCFGIGAISGTMNQQSEESFIVKVIKELLGLVQKCRRKAEKAMVAANIMWIVGQYPRFLRNHFSFLRTVVRKLDEFTQQEYPGVKDMAVDTFLRVLYKTKDMFLKAAPGQHDPLIRYLVKSAYTSYRNLEPHQQLVYIEAVGYPISCVQDATEQEHLVDTLLFKEHQKFEELVELAKQDQSILFNPETIQYLHQMYRIMKHLVTSAGQAAKHFVGKHFNSMLNVYRAYIEIELMNVTNKPVRALRKSFLQLLSAFVKHSLSGEEVLNYLLPAIESYVTNFSEIPQYGRDPDLVLFFETCVSKLKDLFTPHLPGFTAAVSLVVVASLEKEPEEKENQKWFVEMKGAYFAFMKALVQSVGPGIFEDQNVVQTTVKSLCMGAQDYSIEIQSSALSSIKYLIEVLWQIDESRYKAFMQLYFFPLLQTVLTVLTDSTHKAGFKEQVKILWFLLRESMSPKMEGVSLSNEGNSSKEAVSQYILLFVMENFQTLSEVQVQTFILKFLNNADKWTDFRLIVRDFVISLKEYHLQMPELYAEQRDEQLRISQTKRLEVPGLIGQFEGLTLSNSRDLKGNNLFTSDNEEDDDDPLDDYV